MSSSIIANSYFNQILRIVTDKSIINTPLSDNNDEIYDPHPVETKWRNSINNIDTPLHFLEYGLMDHFISPLVKKYRYDMRHNLVVELIKQIHNDQLDVVWKNIVNDAKLQYGSKFSYGKWKYGVKNKAGRVKFFEKNDISIRYLTDQLDIQKIGPPQFSPRDLVVCCKYGTPYIIREKIGRGKFYLAYKCKTKWVVDPVTNRGSNKPVWHKYSRSNPCGGGPPITDKINSWKFSKVGVETSDIVNMRKDAIDKYNDELKKRRDFWDNTINPLLLHSPGHRGRPYIYLTYFDQSIDLWNLVRPPMLTYNFHRNIKPVWDSQWEIVIDAIRNM